MFFMSLFLDETLYTRQKMKGNSALPSSETSQLWFSCPNFLILCNFTDPVGMLTHLGKSKKRGIFQMSTKSVTVMSKFKPPLLPKECVDFFLAVIQKMLMMSVCEEQKLTYSCSSYCCIKLIMSYKKWSEVKTAALLRLSPLS